MEAALTFPDWKTLLTDATKQIAEIVTTELRNLLSKPAPALLSADQVASILGISERQVWRMASAGELPAPKRVGTLTKWRRSDIDAYVEN